MCCPSALAGRPAAPTDRRPLRIGIVCFAALGGSSTVAASLAGQLAGAGHAVFLLAPVPPLRLQAGGGVRFRAMPGAGHPLRPGAATEVDALARSLAAVVAADGLDVLHAHYAHPHGLAAVRARDLLPVGQRPVVVTTLHGTEVTALAADPAMAASMRAALLASDGVSAVSDFLADAARSVFHMPRPVVIPNAVDAVLRAPGAGGLPPRPAGQRRVLLHVSTLRPVKRAVDCVAILALVNRRLPCRLLVVGEGPDADALRREAVRLDVADQLCFAGATADVGSFLRQADLLLLPSASESFGMAALEAMAAGVPVVGSRVGGLVEVALDGVCARLLPVGDVAGMAQAACELLLDPRLAAAYGQAGRRIARARYAPAAVADAYLGLYARALGAAARARGLPCGSGDHPAANPVFTDHQPRCHR